MSEVFRLRDQVEWRVVEGEVLALDVAAQTYLSSNRTGAVLWSALAKDGGTRAELTTRLVTAFDVDEQTAAGDVDTFLAALDREGLLVRGG